MTTLTAQSARERGYEAIDALRLKAQKFASDNLPKAAAATESAGQAVADFALSSSRSLARALHEPLSDKSSKRGSVLLQAAPLLRTAGRFALRNPALIAATGAAVALVGYAAWRKRNPAD